MKDGRCRAIILIERYHLRIFPFALERKEQVYVRSAPAVNGLLVVANGRDALCALAEKSYQRVLGTVHVLILVNEKMPEAGMICGAPLGELTQESRSFLDEIIEVECVVALKFFLILVKELKEQCVIAKR